MSLLGGEGAAATTAAPATTSVSTGTAAASTTAAPATTTAAPAATTTLAGGSTSAPASWRDGLSDDLKAAPTLSKFSDVSNLSKAYIELEKKIGAKGIIKPGANASAEETAAFREAMGIPTGDKYQIGTIEGVTFPKEALDWARSTGDKLGVDPTAMTGIMKEYAAFEKAQDDALEAGVKEEATKQLDALKQEWGVQYDVQVQRAAFAAKELGGEEFIKYLNETGMGNDVNIIKLMAKVSTLLGEDKLREGNVGEGRQSAAELDIAIKETQAQLIKLKPNDGMRPAVLARMESLYRQKTGGR